MPKLTSAVPKYRRHKHTGQAVVTLGGRDFYLGKHGTAASKAEYNRLVGEWVAKGRPAVVTPTKQVAVSEVILAYVKFAKGYYRKAGKVTDELAGIKAAVRHLKALYGRSPATDFGPLALENVRQRMIETRNSRNYVNKQIGRIKRMFKWAASQELIPASVYHGLATVDGLRKGRTEAREMAPVRPVDDAVVDATIKHAPATVAAMVRFQRLTGARPDEICRMRPADIDRTGDLWLYRPQEHKNDHRGKGRIIVIGPRAQQVLTPYLFSGDRPCFRPRRVPEYRTRSYRNAIHRAVERANRELAENGSKERLPFWGPNRLRHSAGTEIRRQFGLEAAQVVLGHAKADVTQIYAERDLNTAIEVARKVG